MKYSKIIVGLLLIIAMNMSYAMETGEMVKKEEPFPLLSLPDPIIKIIGLPSSMKYRDILDMLATTKALSEMNKRLNKLFAADVAMIRTMLDEANCRDKNGYPPLWNAREDTKKMQWLVNNGANVNCQMANPRRISDGNTLLMDAAYFGHIEFAEFLLQHGADKNIKNKSGYNVSSFIDLIGSPTPDMLALLQRYDEPFPLLSLPEELIKYIGFPSSMQYKVILDKLPTTKALMQGNQYLNKLFAADVAKIRKMLDEANNCDENLALPLELAIRNKDYEKMQHLINNGANMDKMDYLYGAMSKKDITSVRMLLINGAKIFFINERFKQAMNGDNFDIASLLIEYGADVNNPWNFPGQWFDGNTLLMNAVFVNDLVDAEFLLQKGAKKNIKNTSGLDLFSYAISPKMIALLERYK